MHFRSDVHANLGARRRVSFEIPHQEEPVPPSPNTRRKNFNFMPISPGPISPGDRQSKCSSTTASPFVSPRDTPVPRSKTVLHQNATVTTSYVAATTNPIPPPCARRKSSLKIKQELEGEYLAMSAPPSPKLGNFAKTKNATLLQSLLNSNNKILLADSYAKTSQAGAVQDPLATEISRLLSADAMPISGESAFRSQSVPLNQMALDADDSSYLPQIPFSVSESNSIAQTPIPSEFIEYDSFVAAENMLNVNKILSTLDAMPGGSSEDVFGMGMAAGDMQPGIADAVLPNLRALGRSHSIEIDSSGIDYGIRYNPSRSVPATPLPSTSKTGLCKNYRSYPSTPLATNEAFCYTHGQDYLINGQPIKHKMGDAVSIDSVFPNGSESNDGMFFGVVNDGGNLNCDILIDDSKVEFNFDGQLPDGGFKTNVGAPTIAEGNGVAYDFDNKNIAGNVNAGSS